MMEGRWVIDAVSFGLATKIVQICSRMDSAYDSNKSISKPPPSPRFTALKT